MPRFNSLNLMLYPARSGCTCVVTLFASAQNFGVVPVPTASQLQIQSISFDVNDFYNFQLTSNADIFGSVVRNGYNPSTFGTLTSVELLNKDSNISLGFVNLNQTIFDNGETKESAYSFTGLTAGNYQFVTTAVLPTGVGQSTNHYFKLNTAVSAVPEPASAMLLVGGLALIGVGRRCSRL